MIVYVVEETGESCWGYYCEDMVVVGVYESKKKALAEVKELEKIHKYREYYITTYDTETGGIIND